MAAPQFSRPLNFLGVLLLLGLAGLTIFAAISRRSVSGLERFSETTAVGDTAFFQLPNPLPDPPAPVISLQGQKLVPVSYAKVSGPGMRDTQMRAVARDAQTRLTIYTPRKTAESAGAPRYFVKLRPNTYLALQAAEPVK